MKLFMKMIKALTVPFLSAVLIVTVAYAATYVLSDGKEVYIMNGKLTVQGDFLPGDDGTHDLGSTAAEWQDAYIDGTLNADATAFDTATINGDLNVTTGDIQLTTTDRALGSDAATKTVKVCGGNASSACDAETAGAWITLEGADFGGTGVGGAIQIEGGAGDATSDITIATNHDDADILLRGGTTQATRVTVEGDTGNVVMATGHLDLASSGRTIIIEDGTAASTCAGVVTANGTTAVTTSTTCIQTGDYVFITRDSAPSGTAECYTVSANIVDGTSWELDCDGAETGTFSWWIVKGQ